VPDARREEQFRTIFHDNYNRILGYALRRTLTPEDAADVVSETFLTAWRRFDDLPPGDESRLWLYGVAHRVLANHHRSERRRDALVERLSAEIGELDLGWHDPMPSDLAPLSTAWHRLRPEDRDLLGMVAWEGLSNEQIARVLGCSRSVLKLRVHRARKRFARQLTEAGIDPIPHTASSHKKPQTAPGHVLTGRAPARPGTEEA
jgi:RNA polymerase sigma-70 factor (ECF subfamily)